jgi:hypothetical protein
MDLSGWNISVVNAYFFAKAVMSLSASASDVTTEGVADAEDDSRDTEDKFVVDDGA